MAPIISPARAKQPGLNLQAPSLIWQPIGSAENRRWYRSAPPTIRRLRCDPPIAGLIARRSFARSALRRGHGESPLLIRSIAC